MSCRRRDLECGASCAIKRQDVELMSARSQTPPNLNPIRIRIRRGTVNRQIMMQTDSRHSLPRHSPVISMPILRCRERHKKTSRTRKATKIKGAALLALLLVCLCRYATSSSISPAPVLQGGYSSNTERRKNNTGFYYGIRDEHISCSSTSTCTLSCLRQSLSWKPAVNEFISKLHGVPHQISLLARDRMHDRQTISNDNASVESTYLPQFQHEQQIMEILRKKPSARFISFRQKLHWRPSADFRQALLQNLSQSMQSMASQHWDQGMHDRLGTASNPEGETILDKAIFGGSISRHYHQFDEHDQDVAIIVGASATKSKSKRKKKKRLNNTGFYYGIREEVLILPDKGTKEKQKSTTAKKKLALPNPQLKEKRKPSQEGQGGKLLNEKGHPTPKLNEKKKKKSTSRGQPSSEMSNILGETMLELREMREEIISLREELQAVKKKLREEEGVEGRQWGLGEQLSDQEEGVGVDDGFGEEGVGQESPEKAKRSRKRDFDRISKEVEKWACNLLFEEERTGNGWKEISCNNMMRKKFNKDGRTQVYLKWMADSRAEQDRERDISDKNNLDYPCIKCYSTIDAPMETVCSFLSDEETIPIYNELVVDHDDVEEITPHSKITWTKMPKVLFVKSRDFVTFCSHRWWRDGTQVIINQACEHDDRPGVMVEGQGDATRGFALRGANFISKDPNDPNKTRITILAHANPGGGLPQWAMNTAVNGVVQIEPFKLFHKINEGACSYQKRSPASSQTAHVNSLPGRSAKPAGIAQLGYTCFWPNGGGLKESNPFSSHPKQNWDEGEEEEEDNDEDTQYEEE